MKTAAAILVACAVVVGVPQQSRAQGSDHDTRITKLEKQVKDLNAQIAHLATMMKQQPAAQSGQKAMPMMDDDPPMGAGMGSQPQNPMGQMPPDSGGGAMPNQGGMGHM